MKIFVLALFSLAISSHVDAGRISITEESLPQSVPYVDLGTITVSSKFYGSADALYPKLAEKARKKDANAVIQTHSYVAPSGFAWAAPHLSGQAIRMNDTRQLDELKIKYRQY